MTRKGTLTDLESSLEAELQKPIEPPTDPRVVALQTRVEALERTLRESDRTPAELVEETRTVVQALATLTTAIEASASRSRQLLEEQERARRALEVDLRRMTEARTALGREQRELELRVAEVGTVTGELRSTLSLFHRGVNLKVYLMTAALALGWFVLAAMGRCG